MKERYTERTAFFMVVQLMTLAAGRLFRRGTGHTRRLWARVAGGYQGKEASEGCSAGAGAVDLCPVGQRANLSLREYGE
jgi:hypothetical protein